MAGLPLLPGPKLEPFRFKTNNSSIEFIEALGDGVDSTVWKVSIDGSIYALKIFGFGHVLKPPLDEFLEKQNRYTSDDIRAYDDPFHCECRVYGRLKETGNEHLSIACYGYIILNSDHEKELLDKNGMTRAIYRWHEEFDNQPLRAIVKEIIEEDEMFGLNPKKIRTMIRDLDTLHEIGIFVNDINAANYLKNVIMDFSRAKTVPHPTYSREYIAWLAEMDIGWLETARNDEYEVRPELYDWEAAERKKRVSTKIPNRAKPKRASKQAE
ncbi:kinetochore Sim4 complex subunit FTA2-domain-containing protein [Xylariaceae sp. FL0662B]|nr:kinetochore Sim4 complex subunit FTA2-domain-containing protein [Xylariaceae sp. FL0662B]